MPYSIGDKGSNGCSGYPVVSDTGRVMGCHPTESNAQEQVAALYAAGAADKADTPLDVANNAVVTDPTPANPSPHLNPAVGLRKPQYLTTNYARPTGSQRIHDKDTVQIWAGSAFGKSIDAEIIAPSTYQGCDCEMCKEMNVDCPDCPMCANPIDSEVAMAMYDSSIGKSSPCWDGYVQRGMKPGKNGKQVPNCVPVKKTESIFSNIGKDYTKSTKETHRIEE